MREYCLKILPQFWAAVVPRSRFGGEFSYEMQWKNFTAYFWNLFAVNALNRGEFFICTAFSVLVQKYFPYLCSNLCHPMPLTAYSTAPTVLYFFNISCEFISDWVNVEKQLRWTFVRNTVNFAVNLCKKCGEKRWNIYYYRIHRKQRIFYKNSPLLLHFLY